MHICIHGGGVLGVCLASELININKAKKIEKITIIEPSKTILKSWDSIKLNNTEVNNGYHTIELPRGLELNKMIRRLTKDVVMEETIQERNIIMDEEYIEDPLKIDNWPGLMKEEQKLIWLRWKERGKVIENMNDFEEILDGTAMEQRIKICRKRYYGESNDSVWQFFPWFFTGIFTRESEDEGVIFRNKIRNSEFKARNWNPKKGLFKNLKEDIKRSLTQKGINIEGEDYETRNADINIWTSSMVNYMKKINLDTSKILINPRKLRLIAAKLKKGMKKYPSEILVLNSEFPEISRIYFHEDYSSGSKFLIVEAIEGESIVREKKAIEFICRVLNIEIENYESKITRYMWFTPDEILNSKREEVIKSAESSNMVIPLEYWRPINMCKQAAAAKNYISDKMEL